jgi:hypothetical protein
MSDVTNVSAGKPAVGGAVACAPLETAMPTSASDTLNNAFANLGYISDDGMTNGNSPVKTIIKAWGGDNVLVSQTDRPDTFKFKLIETLNINVLKTIYGSENVTGALSAGITVDVKTAEVAAQAYVVDMIMRDGALKRIVIPNGVMTELGEIKYNDSEVAGYEVTISAMPDSNGSTHKEYILRA